MANGYSLKTGRIISGKDRVAQSILFCLRTPKESRLLFKEFGSDLYKLIDADERDLSAFALYCERALSQIKEFRLKKVRLIQRLNNGRVELEIEGEYLPDAELLRQRLVL